MLPLSSSPSFAQELPSRGPGGPGWEVEAQGKVCRRCRSVSSDLLKGGPYGMYATLMKDEG